MLPKNIPDDINIEILLSLFPEGRCKVSFAGTHKRNAYNDFVGLEEKPNNTLSLSVGRTSLYNTLPEILFHPMDRFGNLSLADDREKFDAEYEAQEREKEQAYKFFSPIDLMLLRLRLMVRERLNVYAETNKVIIDQLLSDEITEAQKQNRFIKRAISFLPQCKSIRGNKTYLTLMLRKVLLEEGLSIKISSQKHSFFDSKPRYNVQLGSDSENIYLGNTYDDLVMTYTIHYWPENECDESFLQLVEELESFRQFIQDYFIAVDGILLFDISRDEEPLRLSDETTYNYMNYNMNI